MSLHDELQVDTGSTVESFVRVPTSSNAANQATFRRKARLPNNRRSEIGLRSSFDGKGLNQQGHYSITKRIDVQLADGTFKPINVNLAIHWPEAALAAGEDLPALVKGAVSQVVSVLRSDPAVSNTVSGATGTAGVNANRIDSVLLGEI